MGRSFFLLTFYDVICMIWKIKIKSNKKSKNYEKSSDYVLGSDEYRFVSY